MRQNFVNYYASWICSERKSHADSCFCACEQEAIEVNIPCCLRSQSHLPKRKRFSFRRISITHSVNHMVFARKGANANGGSFFSSFLMKYSIFCISVFQSFKK